MKINLISILWGSLLCLLLLSSCKEPVSITMTTLEDEITIQVGGTGTAIVDWGDGKTQDYTLGGTFPDVIFHNYATTAKYTITITGENITYLWCSGNQLTSLDVSNNTALEELYCDDNKLLTSLDVSNNTALKELLCSGSQLTSLDVSNNTALKELLCSGSQLTSLDVSKNTALTRLGCSDNQLTSLDVSNNTALEELWCDGNQLTSLDVSQNTALTRLICYDNQLTATELNALFGTLHSNTIANEKNIYIYYNPGTGTCNQSIATAKGWEVYDYPIDW